MTWRTPRPCLQRRARSDRRLLASERGALAGGHPVHRRALDSVRGQADLLRRRLLPVQRARRARALQLCANVGHRGTAPGAAGSRAWRAGLNGGEPPPTDEIPAELYPYCRFTLDWYCEPDSPRWGADPPRIVTVPGLGYFPSGYQYAANHPPLYYAAMAPLYAASSAASPVAQHYLLRLAAIPFGLVTVYAAYRATRALFPGDAFLTVTVPALVAFQPQISYEAAMVNNDIVAIALTSLIIWGLIVGMRDRFPLRLCAALGVALGLDLLAKGTAITVAPVIAAALVLGVGWRDWRGLLTRGVAVGVPAILLAAPWYLFLYRTYGDFSGLARVEELQYWNSPMGSFFELLVGPGIRRRPVSGDLGRVRVAADPPPPGAPVGDRHPHDPGPGGTRRLRIQRLAKPAELAR